MPFDRPPSGASVIDILEHIIDKGIVFDAWVPIAGIALITSEYRVVVVSVEPAAGTPARSHIPATLPTAEPFKGKAPSR